MFHGLFPVNRTRNRSAAKFLCEPQNAYPRSTVDLSAVASAQEDGIREWLITNLDLRTGFSHAPFHENAVAGRSQGACARAAGKAIFYSLESEIKFMEKKVQEARLKKQ